MTLNPRGSKAAAVTESGSRSCFSPDSDSEVLRPGSQAATKEEDATKLNNNKLTLICKQQKGNNEVWIPVVWKAQEQTLASIQAGLNNWAHWPGAPSSLDCLQIQTDITQYTDPRRRALGAVREERKWNETKI